MIKVNTRKQKKKTYTETINVSVFYATKDNEYDLIEGWYEWTEESGVPKTECGTLTLAFLPNEPYRRFMRDQALRHKKAMRKGRVSQDKIDEIDITAVAKFGIKAWEGFQDKEDQEEIGYDPAIGFNALFNDRALLDLVCDLCRDEDLFGATEKEIEDEAIKNC